tara:strand:+ start:443 stop:970 length:528 start_codon:yes stop_codon:yes gene_type:complete
MIRKTQRIESTSNSGNGENIAKLSNFERVLANSPAVFEAYSEYTQAIANGTIPAPLREKIALVVSELNNSEYDVSAHSQRGSRVGLSEGEITQSRLAESLDPRETDLLNFVQNTATKSGILNDKEFEAVKRFRDDNAFTIEVIALIALTIFENLLNNLAHTTLDFPLVKEIPHQR